jgi:hypothetical protein
MCKWILSNLARGILICGMLAGFPLGAQSKPSGQSKKTQAQHLVDLTAQKHPEVGELELSTTRAGQRGCVTIAATKEKDVGEKCDADEATALKTLEPFVERERDGFDVTAPLHDTNGNVIGTLGVDFSLHAGKTRADILKRTTELLREIEQQIPSKAFLFQPVSAD